ncbi:MAG: VWA domain-containing protein [Candidatus Hydrogenedens sp.]|nr:VWA domain-containing protein [Candidatus Hydrogenedens sp.]
MMRHLRLAGLAVLAAALLPMSGCFRPIEAIDVSNPTLDFALNTRPLFIDVWNNNPDAGTLEISVGSNRSWILFDVNGVVSAPPNSTDGPFDKQSVRVTIDRTQLGKGDFTGRIDFTARGVVTRSVDVLVKSNQDNSGVPLNIVNPKVTFSSPYLLDFNFALRDANGGAVVAEPAQFNLSATEGDTAVTFESGLQLQRAASRQLLVELVLDYSLTLQAVPGAIAAMEDAAKNVFLPALNDDALVGVTEFHVDDRDAQRVAEFTTDRDFLRAQIDTIQDDFVGGFAGFARIYDTIIQAVTRFDGEDPDKEDRYIVLFTDGNDTSSVASLNAAVGAANAAGVSIYTVAVGQNINEVTLIDIATRTGGLYIPANTSAQLAESFQQVVNDLEAQYTVRWASGQRSGEFTPRFTLGLNNASTNYTSPDKFRPSSYAGDVRKGKLFLVQSDNTQTTTVFLRAQYVPRQITQLVLNVSSPHNFVVSLVEKGQNGLIGDWSIATRNVKARDIRITLTSTDDTPLPFASLGPLLRFDFPVLLAPEDDIFTDISVDNGIYTQGQTFEIDGF